MGDSDQAGGNRTLLERIVRKGAGGIIVVEALTQGMPMYKSTQEVLRWQGVLLELAYQAPEPRPQIWWIQAQKWQAHFELRRVKGEPKGQAKGRAALKAKELGWENQYILHWTGRDVPTKVKTDYNDAFLISTFAEQVRASGADYEGAGCSIVPYP